MARLTQLRFALSAIFLAGAVSALATAAAPAASGAAGAGGPSPVVVIVLENHSYASIVGNPSAPFINGTLIAHGLLEQQYYSVYPNSGENYLAMTAGITDVTAARTAPNLFASLPSSVPWRAFEESMPSTCYSKTNSTALVPGTSIPLYTKGHNPAVRFDNVSGTGLCANDVPLDPAHFDPADLPAFSYVVPNQCNDMHTMPTTGSCPRWDGGTGTGGDPVALADAWLARFVPLVAGSATVVVTWDEGSGGSQRVPAVLYGLGVTHGVDQTTYDHFSLEAGLYRHFGVAPVPGQGAGAVPLPLPQVGSTTPSGAIGFVGSSSFNGNVTKATVKIPAAVKPGDAILLLADANNSSITASAPSGPGWTLLKSTPNGTAITRIYAKVAAAGDPGSTVTIKAGAIEKLDVQLVAYTGTAATPVTTVASTAESATSTTHTTPSAAVATAGSWAVSFWDDKSATTTSWTPPAGQTRRAGSIGTGSAAMSSLVTDGAAPLTTESFGGLTARTNDAAKATTATVVLAPS